MVRRNRPMEKVSTPRLLVVGGSGFIGRHVAAFGVRKGWRVTSLSIGPHAAPELEPGVTYLSADLRNSHSLSEILNSPFEYIVNLAGYVDHTPFKEGGRRLIDSHFNGLVNLLQCLNRKAIKRFVQIGSSDEYGNAPAPQHESLRECPGSPYALAKLACTHFLQMLSREEGFPVVILRLFLIYGPGQNKQRFLPQVIEGCLGNRSFPVSEGRQLRDFCYINDLVDAIYKCFENSEINGHVINIASGIPIEIRHIVHEITELVGGGQPQFGQIAYRQGENMALYGNINIAKQLLGWEPKTPLYLGLKTTIESMKLNADYGR